jgi:hypothetical protein
MALLALVQLVQMPGWIVRHCLEHTLNSLFVCKPGELAQRQMGGSGAHTYDH